MATRRTDYPLSSRDPLALYDAAFSRLYVMALCFLPYDWTRYKLYMKAAYRAWKRVERIREARAAEAAS